MLEQRPSPRLVPAFPLLSLLTLLVLVTLLALPGTAAFAGEKVEPPAKVIEKVAPQYPEEARKEKIEGVVIVKIRVETDGSVQDPEILSGPEVFHQATLDAVNQWRFEAPQESFYYNLTFNYRLDHDGEKEEGGKEGGR